MTRLYVPARRRRGMRGHDSEAGAGAETVDLLDGSIMDEDRRRARRRP